MTVHLRTLLLGRQQQLAANLRVGRELIGHAPSKGTASEFDWAGAIAGFLPRRYSVSSAFVIDANGDISDQIDLVVHDAHFCPLFFEQGGARFIPAESVFAAFEVKQELDKEVLVYAGDKVASVRRLRRTNAPIVERGEERPPREPLDILGGVLTLESGWSPSFGDAFEENLRALIGVHRLDLGCAISSGAFEQFVASDQVAIEVGEAEGSLMFFLLRLFSRLQGIGSPMAIDLREYSRSLEE